MPISVEIRKPCICLKGRSFDGAVLIRNKHKGEYPEKNKELMVDLQASLIGSKKGTWEFTYHYHVRKLKPHEELRLNFKGLFKNSGAYEIKVGVTEVEVLETGGDVDYDEEHVIIRHAHKKIICAGEGWQVRFSETEKGKSWGMRAIRCYSLHEILTTIGAIIVAISSVLALILTFYTSIFCIR